MLLKKIWDYICTWAEIIYEHRKSEGFAKYY
jgi:hypothetical protein